MQGDMLHLRDRQVQRTQLPRHQDGSLTGTGGSQGSIHRLCRLSAKYDARNAERLFSAALASGRGYVHLGAAFWFAKQHGVEVGAPPKKDAKMQCMQRHLFHTGARTL